MVLECDDSRANMLSGGSWGEEGPQAPWAESFSCAGQGGGVTFRGDVEDDYQTGPSLSSKSKFIKKISNIASVTFDA